MASVFMAQKYILQDVFSFVQVASTVLFSPLPLVNLQMGRLR